MSLNVGNCPRCGKIYVKNIHGICPHCIKEMELQYEKCLKYLREYRSCTLQELSEATDVPMQIITKFIREGRISIKHNPNMSIACEVCGGPIREGLMCESCRGRLLKDVSNMSEDEQRNKLLAEQKQEGISFKIKDRLNDRLK
ncbi:flagellar protein [Paenibacillus thalictri]|uniref:Flagellar protein n=1 Tax=Paenibacillus thalictri TaxID=2527873 RepID=A0A4Q9DIH1_9BACL|nr:flagellar protein [Paenibacillus thalictri]TBL72989.1 flagellar protein [Paenibacillus thalictri]